MIKFCQGDDLGVPRIPECMVVEWAEGNNKVVFSYAQQGKGITAHFAAAKKSLREVKTAINDFCEWVFWAYPWCRMIFAVIGIKSVERLVQKCGFKFLTAKGPYQVYARYAP
jgi:hypothetical protein